MSNVYQKLSFIQRDLKAPKGQYNNFGKYKYRSCEDILEALKPVCLTHNTTLFISDNMELLGDRYYIKATVTLVDIESGELVSNSAYAREPLDKKGMDSSQITGTASSYARKYALNGLFSIDDTKDADTNEFVNTTKKATDDETDFNKKVRNVSKIQKAFSNNKETRTKILGWYKVDSYNDLTLQQTEKILASDSYKKTLGGKNE